MKKIIRLSRAFLLVELVCGFALTLKYMFKKPVTINYPYEKGALSENTPFVYILMAQNAVLPANYVRRFAQHKRLPLRLLRV